MKSSRIAFVTPIFTIGLSVGLVSGAWAADFYVSADKSYGTAEGADADHRFDDLQAAIDAAVDEDTVWIADGFECKAGEYEYASGYKCRIYIDKELTLRSKSGDWTTGSSPIIRGSYATAGATGSSRCGAGAVTCVRGTDASKITLMGIKLLEGATTQYANNQNNSSGGGAFRVTLQKCLVSGCAAYYGGGTYGANTADCTFRDCFAYQGGGFYAATHSNVWAEACRVSGHGGGGACGTVYDSVITNCFAEAYGGGFGAGGSMTSYIYNSVIVDCTVKSNYGGAMYNSEAHQCEILRCNRGAAANCKTYDCDFTDCYDAASNSGSAIHCGSSSVRIVDCTFVGNGSPVVGAQNGGSGTEFKNCMFDGNDGTVFRLDHNNVHMTISNCVIRCMSATGYAIYVQPWSSGNSPQYVTVLNSRIIGPVAGCGDYYNCLISGCNTKDIPAVSCSEKAARHTDPAHPLSLYNCTVRGNETETSAAAASDWVYAYNTLFVNNTSKAQVADRLKEALSCRLDDSTVVEGDATGTIHADPLLMDDANGLPHPSESSPCRAGGDLQYVATETDLAGNPRTSAKDGVTVVAIGACEFDPNLAGAEISCSVQDAVAPASGVFAASCSGLGTEGLVYYWDLDGDGSIDVVTENPTCRYSYPLAGAYTAALYASNAVKGVSATYLINVPEGYFVSSHEVGTDGRGVYVTPEGYRHPAYTNLQQAIAAAPSGGIVWIDSDFVCDEGATELPVGGTEYPMSFRIVVDKPLTLHGKTGDWRTGPTIRGAYGKEFGGTPASRRGEGAVACIRGVGGDKSQVIVEGVRLVGGATKALRKNELCGACASYVTLKNCLAQGGAAYNGGCVGYSDTEGCQIEDGYAAGFGGGTYGGYHTNSVVASCTGGTGGGCAGDTSVSSFKVVDCVITNCSVGGYGGGTYYGSFYGCTIVDSRAGSFGAAGYRSNYYGCEVRRCESGALTGGNAYDCLFVSNKISNSSSAYASAYYFYPDGGTASYIVSNCTFTGNASPAVASGSYMGPDNLLVDCTVTNNLGNGLYVYHANSPAFVRVVNCRFGSTPSGKFAVLTDKYQDRTNASGPEVVNSVIEGPVQGSGEYYNCLFKNISVAAQAPIYCTDSLATGPAGARRPLTLVNCTVASNAATRAAGGVGGGYVVAVNSIIRENVGKDGLVDSYLAASNSCVEADAAIGDAYRCTTERPRFDRNTPGREFVPRASALRGMAQVFAWMSDPADPRSRDLAGRDRITDGAPDMGAFEMYPPVGLILMVR